ncbi:tail assembly chaperone [Mycobacterium phage 40BC]|nr:tail assembly chaperone [Mycobacterium phage 40BC]
MATFGAGGKMITDDADQLVPPADLTERDPDPYGDNEPGEAVPVPVEEQVAQVNADDEYPARPFREDEPRSEGAVARVAPDPEDAAAKQARLAELRAELAAAEAEAAPAPEGTAVALIEKWDVKESGETWPYDFLEFEGDLLGVRLPQKQALAAFSLASSKYVSLGVKNDLTGLFIARHLSPESYGRVFSRLMDPDDDAYDVETVGELFNAIVTASVEADKSE